MTFGGKPNLGAMTAVEGRTSHNCDANITPANSAPGPKPQRFAAKQRHGFGFHLADVAGSHFGISQAGFVAMIEQLVTELMEKG